MFRFTIRDVLWLMVVVGMGVGWWGNRQDMLANESLLRSERDVALNDYRDLAAREKMLADDWKLLVGSLQTLRIDGSHIVSAAKLADGREHAVQVLIEPRPPFSLHGRTDIIR